MASPNEVLLTLLSTQCVLSLSPGPNWVLVVQNSLRDRKLGLATAAGILPAVMCFAGIGLLGGSALFAMAPIVPTVLRIICGCYLMYLGLRSVLASFKSEQQIAGRKHAAISVRAAFMMGFINTITNPKAIDV